MATALTAGGLLPPVVEEASHEGSATTDPSLYTIRMNFRLPTWTTVPRRALRSNSTEGS
jgi:hypothetical protein